jgi:hypothetical protein
MIVVDPFGATPSFGVDEPSTPFFSGRRPIHPILVRRVTRPGRYEDRLAGQSRRRRPEREV